MPGCSQDMKIGIGLLPEAKEGLVGRAALDHIRTQRRSARLPEVGEWIQHRQRRFDALLTQLAKREVNPGALAA